MSGGQILDIKRIVRSGNIFVLC